LYTIITCKFTNTTIITITFKALDFDFEDFSDFDFLLEQVDQKIIQMIEPFLQVLLH